MAEKIGLIGLGLVGTSLAERLLRAGYQVLGLDIDPQRQADLAAQGGEPVGELPSLVRRVDQCLLSLPTSQIAESVLSDPSVDWSGKLIIDTTTGDPESSLRVGQRMAEVGSEYLDATIVGSSKQVQQGQVVVLVGGHPSAYETSRPLLATFSTRSFHLGGWGSGARMKLVVNLVLGLNRAVLAEGLTFARACGVDPGVALQVLQATLAYSRVMDTKGRKMIEREFTVEARLTQHHKDVGLILAAAARVGQELPLSQVHDSLLRRAEELGYGSADNSAIISAYDGS